jgi:hypothetical protein
MISEFVVEIAAAILIAEIAFDIRALICGYAWTMKQ